MGRRFAIEGPEERACRAQQIDHCVRGVARNDVQKKLLDYVCTQYKRSCCLPHGSFRPLGLYCSKSRRDSDRFDGENRTQKRCAHSFLVSCRKKKRTSKEKGCVLRQMTIFAGSIACHGDNTGRLAGLDIIFFLHKSVTEGKTGRGSLTTISWARMTQKKKTAAGMYTEIRRIRRHFR